MIIVDIDKPTICFGECPLLPICPAKQTYFNEVGQYLKGDEVDINTDMRKYGKCLIVGEVISNKRTLSND